MAKKLIRLGVQLKDFPIEKSLRLHVMDGKYAMIS